MNCNCNARLEEQFVSAWENKKDSPCFWWNGEWWTWNRIAALADDCEQKLRAAGFEKGQRIAVLLPNSPIVFALSVAAWRIGGAIAPLNARTGIVNLVSTIKMLDVHS
ncbi:MAG: AMP-binding protein, partial [Synergistaceae bacterium]